jgi:hypothetical protein
MAGAFAAAFGAAAGFAAAFAAVVVCLRADLVATVVFAAAFGGGALAADAFRGEVLVGVLDAAALVAGFTVVLAGAFAAGFALDFAAFAFVTMTSPSHPASALPRDSLKRSKRAARRRPDFLIPRIFRQRTGLRPARKM